MATNPPPMPTDQTLVTPERMMDFFWVQYFVSRDQLIQNAASTVQDLSATDQEASIATTALDTQNIGAFWRLNLYEQVTRAATATSSVDLVVTWTDGGLTRTKTYPAMTLNTTAQFTSDVFVLRNDPSTPITYTTTYASTGVTTMQYSLELALERLV